MWHVLLSPAERKKLGGDPIEAWHQLGTAGMWVNARQVSVEEAILDIAIGIGHLTQSNYDWLKREMGLRTPANAEVTKGALRANRSRAARQASPKAAASSRARPKWDSATGELWFEGDLVRKVRIIRTSHICRVLDAFQELKWPRRIDDPLPGGAHPERVRLAVQSLNQGLKKICFHSQDGGRAIRWSLR